MKKLLSALALILAIVTALTGCGGKLRYPSYYTLNLPAPPDPPAPEGVRTSIAVREFQSPGYLRQGPIVYRTTPEEVGFYEYHRWAADPRTLVTRAVIDHLRAGSQFSMVSMYDGRPNNDYVFSGKFSGICSTWILMLPLHTAQRVSVSGIGPVMMKAKNPMLFLLPRAISPPRKPWLPQHCSGSGFLT